METGSFVPVFVFLGKRTGMDGQPVPHLSDLQLALKFKKKKQKKQKQKKQKTKQNSQKSWCPRPFPYLSLEKRVSALFFFLVPSIDYPIHWVFAFCVVLGFFFPKFICHSCRLALENRNFFFMFLKNNTSFKKFKK